MGIKKLNLLYIATNSAGGGGVSRILSQKTAAFIALGHQVQLVSTNDTLNENKTPFYPFHPAVQVIYYPQRIQTIAQMKRYYAFIQTEVISSFKPDVIFVVDNGIKAYFAPYFLQSNVPIYLEVHGSRHFLLHPISSFFKRTLVDQVTRYLSRYFDGLILLNESSRSDWKHPNLQVIPNWIELTSNQLQPKTTKQIVAMGRLAPEKNYETLLQIWADIHREKPDWSLFICGTGEPTYVEQLKKNAPSSIQWMGEITAVQTVLTHSAFLLHTSLMEGMPMVFLEAMAAGIPVIAFDVDFGPADLIEDGKTGYLVQEGDTKRMQQCALQLMNHPDQTRQMGEQARESIQKYEKQNVLNQWISFFEAL